MPEDIDRDDKVDIHDQNAQQEQPSQQPADLGESLDTLAGDQKPRGPETLQKEAAEVKVPFDDDDPAK